MASIQKYQAAQGQRWRVRYYDAQGSQRSKSFASETDAKAFAAITDADKFRGTWLDPRLAQTPYSEWAEHYLQSKVNLKEKTRDNYESMIELHIKPQWSGSTLGSIRPTAVQGWVNELSESLSAKYVRYVYMVFKASLKLAVQQGYLHKTPCQGINLPRVKPKEVTFLTAQEVELLAKAIHPHYRTLVYFLAYSGARWGEAAGLKAKYVLGNRVRIAEALVERRGHLTHDTPKSNKPRTIIVPSFVETLLAERIGSLEPEDPVFVTETGALLRNSNFRRNIWLKALERCGLNLRVHDLRHTCVALLISQGANPKAVQQQLGHHSVAFTLDRYGHLFDADLDALAGRLDALRASVA